jgi:hypothetical protein
MVKIVFEIEREHYHYEVEPLNPLYETLAESDLGDKWVAGEYKGISLQFSYGGYLGTFDIQNLLIQLVTGLGMISIAKTVTQTTMKFVAPLRNQYRLFTEEMTPDFKLGENEVQKQLVLDAELAEKDFQRWVMTQTEMTELGEQPCDAAKKMLDRRRQYNLMLEQFARGADKSPAGGGGDVNDLADGAGDVGMTANIGRVFNSAIDD